MKNYSEQQFFLHKRSSRFIATEDYTKLSDNELIDLQDSFLTAGFHCMRVLSIHQGRAVIKTFLTSLHCYHNIVALSIDFSSINIENTSTVHDVYQFLKTNNYLHALDQYFIYYFDADFMWIEVTEYLQASNWLQEFIYYCDKFDIHKKIPIFIIETV